MPYTEAWFATVLELSSAGTELRPLTAGIEKYGPGVFASRRRERADGSSETRCLGPGMGAREGRNRTTRRRHAHHGRVQKKCLHIISISRSLGSKQKTSYQGVIPSSEFVLERVTGNATPWGIGVKVVATLLFCFLMKKEERGDGRVREFSDINVELEVGRDHAPRLAGLSALAQGSADSPRNPSELILNRIESS